MNAKLCKHLRRMARSVQKDCFDAEGVPIVFRKLLVDPRHERRLKTTGQAKGCSAVNDPNTFRGIHRSLKRKYRDGLPI